MAFTTEQEAKLLSLISAYDGAKRLVDLPNVSGSNPVELIVEVSEDGVSK